MTRAKHQRYTRSSDLTLKEELDNFLTEHIKYLQREKKRVERFFKENGINGENLETNLEELEKIIKERDELKECIDKLIEESNEFKKSIDENKITRTFSRCGEVIGGAQREISELHDDNQRLRQDLEVRRRLGKNRIANQNVQIRNLQERVEQSERGMPMLTRQNAFRLDHNMDTDAFRLDHNMDTDEYN
ncbi:1244_t:CDS:2 [Racocetra persica]|uniref:1244_t:CDS:1 n=1 Tax=Racocetra persica TaxID=160502 RepID=A0ACA9L1Q3_9GLOM|nr:1244_t:CDS:2 [Racocetra persica]